MENNKVIKIESTNIKTKYEWTSKQKKGAIVILNKAARLTQGHSGNCFEMMKRAEHIVDINKD